MKKVLFIIPLTVLLFWACNTPKAGVATPPTPPKVEAKQMPAPVAAVDSMTPDNASDAMASKENLDSVPVYRAMPTLTNDILHTKLDVKFDWQKQHLLGKAWITAKPYFYPTQIMELDAKGFDINEITFEGSKTPLKYTYDGLKLFIDLGKVFTRNDRYTVYVDYVAKPNDGPVGGSAAITSDKGLYFINPDNKEIDKPRQVWTQGETESNSRWFPTFDKPNERMTSEIYMTVEKGFKTLSNGLMKESKSNADGTRTDHWVMDLPSAPYLVMMAAGDFVIEKEMWRGKEIQYYLEPKYAGQGKIIYKYVPEILEFYSNILGVEYPWQKLANIVARDYVSGAMENTTAILYGDFLNGDERELAEREYNETVICHEIFHHWFGDYVTAESWSNLTVNESFADFSEGLWLEHKFGKDYGDYHRKDVLEGYLRQAAGTIHPLVDFKYSDKEAMFDGHSYNKGGSILNMLRHYLGDEAFFGGLKKYLTDNAFKTGEAHQLRLALEAVSGQDLNWFFNEWYYKAGHPSLEITYAFDAATKKASATVAQTQSDKNGQPRVFQLPIDFDIYTPGVQTKRQTVTMTQRKQTFVFDVTNENAVLDFDADRILVCEKMDKHTDADWRTIYAGSTHYLARQEAVNVLANSSDADSKKLISTALNDKFWAIREQAIDNLAKPYDESTLTLLDKMANSDNRYSVRAKAIEKLGKSKDKRFIGTLINAMENDKSYRVNSAALKGLNRLDSAAAFKAAKNLEKTTNPDLLEGVSEMYAKTPVAENAGFFENNLSKVDGQPSIAFVGNYMQLISKTAPNADALVAKVDNLKSQALKDSSPWRRFAIAKGISDLRKKYKGQAGSTFSDLTKMVSEIAKAETNEQLKTIFLNLVGGQ